MERRGACIRFWWENWKERNHWGDPGVDGRIILGLILGSEMWGYGLDWAGKG
jgi:hypothetical protein